MHPILLCITVCSLASLWYKFANFSRIRILWKRYNPFDISEVVDRVVSKFDCIETRLQELQTSLQLEINYYKEELELQKLVLGQIGDSLPDMVWFKDLEGKYLYANKSIRETFLFNDNPLGKTDVELSDEARARFGEENYTFGKKCYTSDSIVLQEEKPMRFLESGKINGKTMYLEVFKNVVRDSKGNVIGVCGTGRDLTEYVTAVKNMEIHCARRCGEAEIVTAFKQYEFEGE